jgi:hypothetical protein
VICVPIFLKTSPAENNPALSIKDIPRSAAIPKELYVSYDE